MVKQDSPLAMFAMIARMMHPPVIFALSLVACLAVQTQSIRDEVHLRATVQAVVPLTSFSGTVTPVGVDPRFALTVRIVSIDPSIVNFSAGTVVTFAIHSPSVLFGTESVKGKTYDFVLNQESGDGKVRFSGLRKDTSRSKDARDF